MAKYSIIRISSLEEVEKFSNELSWFQLVKFFAHYSFSNLELSFVDYLCTKCGTLYAKCQHCGSNSRAISSRMDGSAFYTFCEQCHEHSIWLARDNKPKPQNIVKHVEPQKWYQKLFKLFKGR